MSKVLDHEPVLVGVGQFVHRPDEGPPPDLVEAMTAAARTAGEDAGGGLLSGVDWIVALKGAWTHPDPAREVAAAVGAPGAHTVLAEVGITQQEVIDTALAAVAGGRRAALILGGEVNHGSTTLAAGAVAEARRATAEPDEHLVSHDLGISPVEIEHLFVDPPTVYAVMEDAFARLAGWDADEHRRALGRLTERFALVAAANPYAWDRSAPRAAEIVEPAADNRMIAEPYTKRCCSNLRVNQAVALLVTTVSEARRAGIPEDRWVFCHGSAFANHAVPVIRRVSPGRSPVMAGAGRRALELAGVGPDDLGHLDLYSCFPAAVQIAAHELEIDPERQLTVTGGMTFGGGPLNSYQPHALATMADVLRADPGSTGFVSAVSGFITKYGASVWSTTPAPDGWRGEDVTAAVAAADAPHEDTSDPGDDVTVVAGTVVHDREGNRTRVAIVETPAGLRTLRSTPVI